MSIELRADYQLPAYERARELRRSGVRRILVQAPTGSGKTDWAAYLVQQATTKGATTHFLVHRRELIRQTVLALHRAGIAAGIVAAGFPENLTAPVQVCSIPSLGRRIHKFAKPPDLVIADEIHHAPAKTWAKLLDYYHANGCTTIGLSATPWRLNGQGLRPWFDEMIVGPSTGELIELGWLSKYRLFAPGHIDMSGVHITAGDYNKEELNIKMQSTGVVGDCLSHYQKYVPGKRALIFTWSVESSAETAERFNAAGIPAVHIDGETDHKIRDRAIKMFENDEIKVLSNVNIAIEGLNIPSVEALFSLRPTASLVLYLQMIGRALRIAPGKTEALIFDHAQNVRRFGLPCDAREWTLDGEPKDKKKQKSDATAAVRVCPKCSETFSMATRVCKCGYVFVAANDIEVEDGELREVDAETVRRMRNFEQGRAQNYEDLVAVGRKRGYPHPERWAKFVMKAREEKALRRVQKPIIQAVETAADRWLF